MRITSALCFITILASISATQPEATSVTTVDRRGGGPLEKVQIQVFRQPGAPVIESGLTQHSGKYIFRADLRPETHVFVFTGERAGYRREYKKSKPNRTVIIELARKF